VQGYVYDYGGAVLNAKSPSATGQAGLLPAKGDDSADDANAIENSTYYRIIGQANQAGYVDVFLPAQVPGSGSYKVSRRRIGDQAVNRFRMRGRWSRCHGGKAWQ
jgi:hypothetical protein